MTEATLRPLRSSDWPDVLAGFTASADMDRQGDVHDERTAIAYVQRLLDPSGAHRPWALGEGGLHRLELGHRANNPASGQVALAAGFIREGCERQKF